MLSLSLSSLCMIECTYWIMEWIVEIKLVFFFPLISNQLTLTIVHVHPSKQEEDETKLDMITSYKHYQF